jgi:PAS domain S-box-containing protein
MTAMDGPPARPDLGGLTLADVLDTITEGFVVYDREWRISYMNRAARGTLASARGDVDVTGVVLWNAFPALRGSPLEAQYRAAMAAAEPVEFEERSPVSGRWFAFRAFPSAAGLSVLAADVSARRSAVDALRSSEAMLRALVDHSAEGILLTAPTGEVLSANPAACRMLGRTEAEMRAAGRSGIVHRDDARLAGLLASRDRTGHASGELTLVRGDGTSFPALLRSTIFHLADGAVRTSLSFRDLTAERAAEVARERAMSAMRDSEELFRLSFEHAATGKALVGLDGRFLRVNQRLCEIVGRPAAELMALRVNDLAHPDDPSRDAALIDALIRGQIPRYELTRRYLRGDGGAVDVLLSVSLLRTSMGAPQLFKAEVLDVTEQRRLESQLALAERMTALGTLAGGIAHEINNPLSAVIGNLDVVGGELAARAAEHPRCAELLSALDDARQGADRVASIVRGMQRLMRAERERRVPLDLHAVIDAAVEIAGNEIRHRARVVRAYGPMPRVEVDEPRMLQVVLGILVNAAEAIPAGRAEAHEIVVRTDRDDRGNAVLEIEDSGSGMSRETRARIFDPFFTTKPIGSGTGLGLSIAHAVVTSLGGTIDVASELGAGTRVRIVLPPAGQPAVAPQVQAALPPVAAGRVRRGRVLVIDDDARVARAVARILRTQHEVVVASGGAEAVARLAAGERFDLILCDVMMPAMGGPAVHAAVAALSPAQADRIVFITGGAFQPEARAFLDAVPNRCLTKPVDAATLRALAASLIAGEVAGDP